MHSHSYYTLLSIPFAYTCWLFCSGCFLKLIDASWNLCLDVCWNSCLDACWNLCLKEDALERRRSFDKVSFEPGGLSKSPGPPNIYEPPSQLVRKFDQKEPALPRRGRRKCKWGGVICLFWLHGYTNTSHKWYLLLSGFRMAWHARRASNGVGADKPGWCKICAFFDTTVVLLRYCTASGIISLQLEVRLVFL
jgi:hypothetical protein